jgi:hypothetical protein
MDQFKVGWAGPDGHNFIGQPINVYAPAGQSRIVAVPLLTNAPASMKPDRIILQGDEEDFDNTVYVIPPEQSRMSVLYLGSESEKDPRQPLYFLQRGFQDTRRTSVRVVQGITNQVWSLAVVTEAISDALAKSLRDEVTTGKVALVVMKDEHIAPTLAQLLSVDQLNAHEAQVHNYAMLAEIDFRHPLFAPFADPRFSDFTKIHFWKYRKIDAAGVPNARVLAKFENGDPALLEVPVGKGKVFVLTSGWHPDDSQLALSTKFVPLLYAFLEESGATAPPPAQFYVGDTVPLQPNEAASVIHPPDGSELRLSSGEAIFSQTMTPGIYTLGTGNGSADIPVRRNSESGLGRRFAVNLDAAESRTAPMPLDELERLGAPVIHQPTVATGEVERKVRLRNTELEERQKLWRWFLLATLGVLFVETWLAGRTARRAPAPEAAA